MKKTFYINILIIIITAFSFVIGYVEAMELPVYAADEIEWEDLSGDDLVDAFKAYCKSRKLFIDGSVPDAVTSFTSQTFENLCKTTGIDMTALQAELKKRYSNGVYKYLFTVTGLNGFNRIFAEFLQNNDLSVGDTVEDTTLYEGEYFSTLDGYTSLIYYTVSNLSGNYDLQSSNINNIFSKIGNKFIYSSDDLSAYYTSGFTSPVINFTDSLNVTFTFRHSDDYNCNNLRVYSSVNNYYSSFYRERAGSYPNKYVNGQLIIIKNPNGSMYCCSYWVQPGENFKSCTCLFPITRSGSHSGSCNIYITTNNTTINNETVINEGDTYIIDDDGVVDDGSGEGEGGGSGEGEGGGSGEGEGGGSGEGEGGGSGEGDTIINFPDIDFNIPDLDFSLSGLTAKFPFCIPFDIVSLLTLLNAEPQAPRIQGSVPIGSWTTWDIDFDFSRFDDFAAIMRGFEIVGFIFFLIGATIRFVKG